LEHKCAAGMECFWRRREFCVLGCSLGLLAQEEGERGEKGGEEVDADEGKGERSVDEEDAKEEEGEGEEEGEDGEDGEGSPQEEEQGK
jgi:hypothetical protein